MIVIDNVGITAFICARKQRPAYTVERKFKAACGSKIIFAIAHTKVIKQITLEQTNCKGDCKACAEMVDRATKLIENA